MARHRAARPLGARTFVAGGVALVTVPVIAAIGVASPDVQLAALVVGASSTNPGGDGVADFYGGLFQQDPTVVANFLTGPFGTYQAIADNQDDGTVVLSSGWGAANTSVLLSYLKATGDPTLSDPTRYVLDNNVARPNGGFGTRYPIFALIGVNPIPTPTGPGVAVLDVGYEYDINGNTPAYVLNPVAMANSLATYFDNRLNQESVELPVTADGDLDLSDDECDSDCRDGIASGRETTVHLDTGETVVVKQVDDTTYVSYRTEGLPLLQPLRTYGGEVGKTIAEVTEPALKAAVDYGYPDNDALANPDKYVPARAIPTRKETQTFVREFTAGVREGTDRLRDDLAPTTTVREAKTLVRTSLAFSPKHTKRAERVGTSPRPVAAVVKSAVAGVQAVAKKLGEKASKPESKGDDAGE